jgi:capsular polysaccharide biosynthesis protein
MAVLSCEPNKGMKAVATIEEKIALVREGRSEFETLELALEDDMESVDKLIDVFARGVKLDMLNGRKAKRIIASLMKVKHALAEVSADVHDIHGEGTKIAKDNDADGELPGEFVVFGGGGR